MEETLFLSSYEVRNLFSPSPSPTPTPSSFLKYIYMERGRSLPTKIARIAGVARTPSGDALSPLCILMHGSWCDCCGVSVSPTLD